MGTEGIGCRLIVLVHVRVFRVFREPRKVLQKVTDQQTSSSSLVEVSRASS